MSTSEPFGCLPLSMVLTAESMEPSLKKLQITRNYSNKLFNSTQLPDGLDCPFPTTVKPVDGGFVGAWRTSTANDTDNFTSERARCVTSPALLLFWL